ncbi:SRPBCC family protein [Kitasatospora sp. NBC_00240]|uniref:SRPBCC family protein n=1 Tax=Kitasatospora sp. NBC_00240 TaxID=2903567 RepID=UPI00224F74C0|nr:SRPBCC family protein [Kitasatospora sp. NBC_00240]MCX5210295.1 SRPBCC family protein [Kitasatospora sp. NBC_00240]
MKLFYAGPSLATLHTEYAKQGRIDDRAPVASASQTRIEAPVERVWAVVADVAGWHRFLPAHRVLELADGVREDARFVWAMGSTRITSRFAVVDPGRELTWTGLAMGVKAVDRHVLTPTGDGATLLRIEESMAAPVVAVLFGRERLRTQHEQWLAAVKAAAEAA